MTNPTNPPTNASNPVGPQTGSQAMASPQNTPAPAPGAAAQTNPTASNGPGASAGSPPVPELDMYSSDSEEDDWSGGGERGLAFQVEAVADAELSYAKNAILGDRLASESDLAQFILSMESAYCFKRSFAFLVRKFDRDAAIATASVRTSRVFQIAGKDTDPDDKRPRVLDKTLDPDGVLDPIRRAIKQGLFKSEQSDQAAIFVAIEIDGPDSSWLRAEKLDILERFCENNSLSLYLYLQVPDRAVISHFVFDARRRPRDVAAFPWAEIELEELSNKLAAEYADPISEQQAEEFLRAADWWQDARLEATLSARVRKIHDLDEASAAAAIHELLRELVDGTLQDPEAVLAEAARQRRLTLAEWLGLDDLTQQDLTKVAGLLALSLAQSPYANPVTHKKVATLMQPLLSDDQIPGQAITEEEYATDKLARKKDPRPKKEIPAMRLSWRDRYERTADRLWYDLEVSRSPDGTIALSETWDAIDVASELYQLAPKTVGEMITRMLEEFGDWMIECRYASDSQFSRFEWSEIIDLMAGSALVMGPNFESERFLEQVSKFIDATWARVSPVVTDPSDGTLEADGDLGLFDKNRQSGPSQRYEEYAGVFIAELLSELNAAHRKIQISREGYASSRSLLKRGVLSRLSTLRTRATALAWLYSFHEDGEERTLDLEALLALPEMEEDRANGIKETSRVILQLVRAHIYEWQRKRFRGEFKVSWKHWVSGLYRLYLEGSTRRWQLDPSWLLIHIIDLCVEADVHPIQADFHTVFDEAVQQTYELSTLTIGGREMMRIGRVEQTLHRKMRFHYQSYKNMPSPASSALIFEDGDGGETIKAIADRFFNIDREKWQLRQPIELLAKRLQDLQTVILGGCDIDWLGQDEQEQGETLHRLSDRAFTAMVASQGLYELLDEKTCTADHIAQEIKPLRIKQRSDDEEIRYQALLRVYGLFWPAMLLHWRCREFGVERVSKGSDDFRRLSRLLTVISETCSRERLNDLIEGLETIERILSNDVLFGVADARAREFYEKKADAARKMARFFSKHSDGA